MRVIERSRGRAAWAGALAASAALGVAEAVAEGLGSQGPVVTVAQAAIDYSPAPLREWAIRTLGESDKTVLVSGVSACVLLASAAIGATGVRRPRLAIALTAFVGLIGVLVGITGRRIAGSLWSDVAPALAATLVAVVALHALLAALPTAVVGARVAGGEPDGPERPRAVPGAGVDVIERRDFAAPGIAGFDRRRFLATATAVGAVGLGGTFIAYGRSHRPLTTDIALPRPADPAPALPAGVELDAVGLSPFRTPNNAFYRVDTAAQLPRVDLASWRLRVHGMVDRELELTFEEVLDRRLIERDITLTCVSNEVGGPYVGNARWLGAPLAAILAEAGVQPGADALKSTSVDGFTVGTPLAAITDGRDAMLAIAMNGEPLPAAHGFPARLVVPGLYGYVSATKWVTDLEVTRFADFTAYWTSRGWSEQAPVKTQARIDHPRQGAFLSLGHVTVAGVAWAQHTGISRVQLRIDDGPWMDTALAADGGIDMWRQWQWQWDAPLGEHDIQVRATDGNGVVQTQDVRPTVPDGASGWHTVKVFAFDGVPTGPLPSGTATT